MLCLVALGLNHPEIALIFSDLCGLDSLHFVINIREQAGRVVK
jgi:hypothetical protein